MIYDGHAYCFPDLRGDGGFDDRQQFQRHLQLAMARHYLPAWRSRDRAPGDNSGLADDTGSWNFDSLKEADFRGAGHGRFEWTVDGEDYFKQYLAPSNVDMAVDADSLVAEMNYAGVDRALLHRNPYLGISNEFIADCVRAFPDRLQGLAYVPEWLVSPETDVAIEKLRHAIGELGLGGLQFLPDHLSLYGQDEVWDEPEFTPYWDAFAELGVPLFVTPGYSALATDGAPAEGLLTQLRTVGRWMERYPDVDLVLTHGLGWRLFADGDTLRLPEEILDAVPGDNPRFRLQLLFPITLGDMWDYPMQQVRPAVEQLAGRLGPERLIWGTDMPIVTRFFTYQQCLAQIRQAADFLKPEEVAMITGGNMAGLMGVWEG